MILETNRLYLREIIQTDYDDLCLILQDKEGIYTYEHAFSDAETQNWLGKRLPTIKNMVSAYDL